MNLSNIIANLDQSFDLANADPVWLRETAAGLNIPTPKSSYIRNLVHDIGDSLFRPLSEIVHPTQIHIPGPDPGVKSELLTYLIILCLREHVRGCKISHDQLLTTGFKNYCFMIHKLSMHTYRR